MIVFDKEPAYVLHRRPYQEANSLVQFLTPEHGRVTAIARASSRMMGKNLSPFIPALIGCSSRGDLFSLRTFDPQGKAILSTPKEQMIGMYINELVVRLVPRQIPSRRLFGYYADALPRLTDQSHCEITLRRFELKLLEITGHGLQLDHDCMTHEPIMAGARYRYEPGEGPVLSNGAQGGELFSGKALLEIGRGLPDGDTQVLRETKALLRVVIQYHLKSRALHTRSLFHYLKEIT